MTATNSKENFVPRKEGRLRNSIVAIHAKFEGRQLVAYVIAGGPGIAYAVAIHEHRSEHSPPSWSGGVTFTFGGVKYLERPLMEALVGMDARMAAAIASEAPLSQEWIQSEV